jgi:hypothetical protein
MVIGAVYFQFFYSEQSPIEVVTPVKPVQVTATVAPVVTKEISLIAESDLLSKESLNELIKGMKCTTTKEKSLCDLFFPDGAGSFEGVIESPGFINIFFPEDRYYAEVRSQLEITTPEEIQKSNYLPEQWLKMAFIVFISSKLSTINPVALANNNINYIFISTEGEVSVSGVMAMKAQYLPNILKSIRPTALKTVKEYGLFTLDPILKYVRIY